MLIKQITELFSKAGLVVEQRKIVARILVRSILKIGSYATDRKILTSCRVKKNLVPQKVEAVIWSWVRDARWDWKLNTCYWRAIACVFETRDFSRASSTFNVPAEDIAYMIAQLETEDITYFVSLNRNWRSAPIDDAAISEVIKAVKRTIDFCSYKLSFVSKYDLGRDSRDWSSYFMSEALQTIYQYEDRKSMQHLVNTIKVALKRKLGIMQGRHSSMKHGMLVNSSNMETNGKRRSKAEDRKTNSLVSYVNRRAALMVQSADGGDEVENPELLSKSTKIEGELIVDVFISCVEKQSAHLARYLKLTTLDNYEDAEFNNWLDQNEFNVDNIRDLASRAAQFCRIDRDALTRLREIATNDGLTPSKQLRRTKA